MSQSIIPSPSLGDQQQQSQQNGNGSTTTTAISSGGTTGNSSNNSNAVGSGTTNQQRLKQLVQQFLVRLKGDSEVLYRDVLRFCLRNREADKCFEFHTGLGELFKPYGEQLGELNKLLHGDFQYSISAEAAQHKLATSDISNQVLQAQARKAQPNTSTIADSTQVAAAPPTKSTHSTNGTGSGPGRRPNASNTQANANSQAENTAESGNGTTLLPNELIKQKVQLVCQIIKEHCPDKFMLFIQELQKNKEGNGNENHIPLFIQTSSVIFGENTQIYQKIHKIFSDQISIGPNGVITAVNQQNSAKAATTTGNAGAKSSANSAQESSALNQSSSGAASNNANTNGAGNEKLSAKQALKAAKLQQKQQKQNQAAAAAAAAAAATSASATNQVNHANNANGVERSGGKSTHRDNSSPVKSNQLNAQSSNNYRMPSSRMNEENDPSISKANLFNQQDGFDHQAMLLNQQKAFNNFGAPKSESNFLMMIDTHMDPVAFTNLLKLLYLYIECIITAAEMVEQGSQLLQGFANPEKYIEQLKDLVECRETSRRKVIAHFKPLNDFDFNTHERFTHSYVEMPKFYPKFCSNATALTRSVLNTSIVTVPQGTEHVTFSIMRKNHYEEQLFKSEDEKYEFDHHIQMYRLTIKTLKAAQTSTDPVKARTLMQQAIDMKLLPYLYKNNTPESQEITELLLTNPWQTARVAIERLKIKLHEIESAKSIQAKKAWHEVSEKNFHRSLDHRSFIFKRHDKKFTQAARFEKEPEFRNKALLRNAGFTSKSIALRNSIGKQQSSHVVLQQLQQQQQQSSIVAAAAVLSLPPSMSSVASTGMTGTALNNAAATTTTQTTAHGAVNPGGQSIHADSENIHDFETDVNEYFKFLNTFQGTTSVEKCSHASSEHLIERFDIKQTFQQRITMPMMTFIFENPAICEDTFSLLMHYIQNYAPINHAEREKIKRAGQIVLKGIFEFAFKQLKLQDITVNENKTIKVVTDIENKIFEKMFAYLRPTNPNDSTGIEEEQNYETAATATGEMQLQPKSKSSKNSSMQNEDEDTNNGGGKSNNSKAANLAAVKKSTFGIKNAEDAELNGKDNDDQQNSMNDIPDDDMSRSQSETIKEMCYEDSMIFENKYLPRSSVNSARFRTGDEKVQEANSKENATFYGTKHLYTFLRFFFVLYERLYKAEETSRYFEDNEKTRVLSSIEKDELASERYAIFKQILLGSLKLRETKYEDYLRSIFGKQAFLLFTIDKTLHSATKSLQALAGDELSMKLLSLYVNTDDFKAKRDIIPCPPASTTCEEILYAKINRIILEATQKHSGVGAAAAAAAAASDSRCFFRFTRERNSNILYINYLESVYKNWDVDEIATARDYFAQYTIAPTLNEQEIQVINEAAAAAAAAEAEEDEDEDEDEIRPRQLFENKHTASEAPVFLSRNKRKNKEKIESKRVKVFMENNIEYIALPNSTTLVSSGSGKEDFLVTSEKLQRRHVVAESLVAVEFGKQLRFAAWCSAQQERVLGVPTLSSSSSLNLFVKPSVPSPIAAAVTVTATGITTGLSSAATTIVSTNSITEPTPVEEPAIIITTEAVIAANTTETVTNEKSSANKITTEIEVEEEEEPVAEVIN